jgi:hypothetical protein
VEGFSVSSVSLFGRGELFLRPGLLILVRRAQGWSRLAEGHRRRRLGLDDHEHGATLGYRRASLFGKMLSRTDDRVAKSRA